MELSKLNEYVFADLLNKYAQQRRRMRQAQMATDNIPEDEIRITPITEDDLRHGLADLEYYRDAAVRLLSESGAEPPESL